MLQRMPKAKSKAKLDQMFEGIRHHFLNFQMIDRIIGQSLLNWKAADHQKAVQLLREGKLALNENADARTLPGKAITTADIAKF